MMTNSIVPIGTNRHRLGRKPIDEKTTVVNMLFTEWSRRTRHRYIRAWRLVEFAGEDIRDVIAKFTRTTGTIRVDAMLQYAEDRAAIALVLRSPE